MKKKTSATQKILETLESGKTLSVAQINKRFKLSNPHSPIYELRGRGYDIYQQDGKYFL